MNITQEILKEKPKEEDEEEKKKQEMIMHHGRESKRRRRQVIKIPNDDVLEEIIVRLPVKTLTRFQTVSKHWRHTIKSR